MDVLQTPPLQGMPIIESRALRYDVMVRMDWDGRPVLVVGEMAQLQWQLTFAELLKAWRADAFASRVAQVAELEYRLFGI